MKKSFILFPLAALVLAGCSTIDSRIAENADFYYSLPIEDQTNIKAGAVDVGFTKDMVFLALGEPDEIGRTLRDQSEVEVWRYVDYNTSARFYPSPWHAYRYGGYYRYSRYRYYSPFWGLHGEQMSEDRIRIEFEDDRVVAVIYPDARDFRAPVGRTIESPGTETTETRL